MPINPDDPYFPCRGNNQYYGASIRCELAKAAMQGMLANSDYVTACALKSQREVSDAGQMLARAAVEAADYLIAALNAAETKGEK